MGCWCFSSVVTRNFSRSDASFYLSSFRSEYTCVYELPDGNNYGGVAVYVNPELSVTERDDLKLVKTCICSKCKFESVWIDVIKNNETFTVGGVYRHPGGNPSHFDTALEVTFNKIGKNETCVMTGDMNINLLNIEGTITTDYISSVMSHGFIPYITRPTRITEYTATLIDHLFIRLPHRQMTVPVKAGILFNDMTDHLPIFAFLSIQGIWQGSQRPKVRIFSDTNIEKFKDRIANINWNHLLNHECGNINCSEFYNYIEEIYSDSFPLVYVSRKRRKDKPWITKGILTSIRHRNKLYRRSIEKPSDFNSVRYKEYRRILHSCLKGAEGNYYQQLLNDRGNSAKNLWKHFGPILNGSKKHRSHISSLQMDGRKITNNQAIADAFNDFFSNVGSNLDRNIGKHNTCFRQYLKDKVTSSFYFAPILESDVKEEMLRLKVNKASGPDNISPKLIRSCHHVLTKPLALLFNSCITSSTFPDDFKKAKVIPLHKQLEKILVDNYRPISLLNCFSKLFERLIHKQVISFLHKHALLYQYQFGFREKHSTTLALIEIIDGIKNNIDKGDTTIGTYLDLKKAFDTVNHPILFKKLEHYGIRGMALAFFQSYLRNRKQYVSCNNTTSFISTTEYGVPQGSVLGPLLFIIYVNDIVNAVRGIKIRLFADDTALFIHGKDVETIYNKMRDCLIRISEWFKCNRLTLHLNKTCYSIFHGPKKKISRMYDKMSIDGHIILREYKVKYLGLMIDETLSWQGHVEYIIASLSKFYGIFNKIKHMVPKKHKLTIYTAYVFSKICYGIEIYGSMNKTLSKRLQVVSNKLLKILFSLSPFYSTNQLHQGLDILQVKDAYKANVLKFVFLCLHNTPLSMFNDYYQRRRNLHERNLRDLNVLHVPEGYSAIALSSTKINGAKLWNNLPLEIRKLGEVTDFRKALHKYFVESYT